MQGLCAAGAHGSGQEEIVSGVRQGLSGAEQRVCAAVASRSEAMVRDLRRYVEIPTGHNFTSGLDELRGLVTDRLRALGAVVDIVPGESKPEWLLGAGTGSIPPTAVCRSAAISDWKAGRGPRVLLASHLDTVFTPPPEGRFLRLDVSSDGSRAVGPGVVDMKGGIVIALSVLEALAETGAALPWTYVFNSDEEMGSYHSERALRAEARRHDVGLATEPALPDGGLAVERLGSGQFMLEARGRSAHVGRDFDKGVSAVTALSRAVVSCAEIADARAGRIVNIGPISGNDAANIVPDVAKAWGNVRFPSREVADDIGRRIDALGTDAQAMPALIVRRSFNRAAKPMTAGVEALALRARAAAEALGGSLPFGKTGGVCDGNILQEEGLPTIDTLGVRGGGLHTEQEWIELASMVDRAMLLAVLLMRLRDGGA